jgi:lipoate-protein ligase A
MVSEFSGQCWRLIDSGIADPAYTMAVDEALLLCKVKQPAETNSGPKATLHLYSRDPPAVSLGYFQKVEDEIRPDLCKHMGVQVLRRGSGGGAIYTDRNQLIYSLVISGESFGTIPNSFDRISQGVLETLKLFGLSPQISGLNDIVIDDKKISGCAQTRKNNYILQHGTILIDFDTARMCQLLTPSVMKFQDKNIEDVAGRMTSLSNLLGYVPTHAEVRDNLVQGFANAFGVTLENGELSEHEGKLVTELLERKYHNSDWNFRR